MKKQNDKNNEQVAEVNEKKTRQKRKFFLYADGKGFVRAPRELGSLPGFDEGEILCYSTKAKAVFAREFLLGIKIADSIDILAKVA